MNSNCLVVSALYLIMSTPVHAADLYKWVDENGVWHLSDKQPPPKQHMEVIRDATPDPPPDKRKAEIAQHLYEWDQQLSYHTGSCLTQKPEIICNKGAERDRQNIQLLNTDPNRYFKEGRRVR